MRIVLNAAPMGPWSIFAGLFEAAGCDVVLAPEDLLEFQLPDDWVPNAVVILPKVYPEARFDQLDLNLWNSLQDTEISTRFALSQKCSLAMSDEDGLVVHVIDRQSFPGSTGFGGGMISAFAAAGLSRGSALDLRGKSRVNVVACRPTEADGEAFVQLVLHLLSEHGKSITGQVMSIGAERAQLFSQPRPVRVAHSDGRWSQDALTQQIAAWADELPLLVSGAKP